MSRAAPPHVLPRSRLFGLLAWSAGANAFSARISLRWRASLDFTGRDQELGFPFGFIAGSDGTARPRNIPGLAPFGHAAVGSAAGGDVGDEPSALTPIRLLLAEDEILVREAAVGALVDAGFEVVTASTGTAAVKALDAAASEPFRALVTDINLGDSVDGWHVARHARELHPEIPVVYVTGNAASEWAVQGVPLSVLVSKPFAPAQIVAAVAQLLNAPPTAALGP